MTRPLTRRALLTLLPPLALTPLLQAQLGIFRRRPKPTATPPPHPFVYFGTDTSKPGAKGIYVSRFDATTGQLTEPILAVESLRPAYLATNLVRLNGAERRLLYATNEGSDAKSSTLSTFLIDPANGSLDQIGQVSSGGTGPCYVSVDASRHAVFVANYAGGSVASYLVRPDGTLSDPVQRIDFHQSAFGHHGPNAARQDAPHPHSAMLSPSNRFLVVNDLGNDDIVIFPVDAQTARLGKPSLNPHRTPGSGPRHLAFHPNGRWAYGIDELGNRIDQYLWNSTRGSSSAGAEARLTDADHAISTIDASFHGANTAAEIAVAPSGNFLYASNRGEDSLIVCAINSTSGAPAVVQRIGCGGKTPRHFTLDPSGHWLVCGNQDSASVTVFARDPTLGRLSGPVQTVPLESPMFTQFA